MILRDSEYEFETKAVMCPPERILPWCTKISNLQGSHGVFFAKSKFLLGLWGCQWIFDKYDLPLSYKRRLYWSIIFLFTIPTNSSYRLIEIIRVKELKSILTPVFSSKCSYDKKHPFSARCLISVILLSMITRLLARRVACLSIHVYYKDNLQTQKIDINDNNLSINHVAIYKS